MKKELLEFSYNELPPQLSNNEIYNLFIKKEQGDKEAREKIIKHNMKLVHYVVNTSFKTVEYDKKELVALGYLALIKAVDKYNTKSVKVVFSTYANQTIKNEIISFLRTLKKDYIVDSLDKPIWYSRDGDEKKLGDIISSDIDILENYTREEINQIIRDIIGELSPRDKEIIMLYFGFYDNKTYSQYQIADVLKISRPRISRIIKRLLKYISLKLQEKGFIELNSSDNKIFLK